MGAASSTEDVTSLISRRRKKYQPPHTIEDQHVSSDSLPLYRPHTPTCLAPPTGLCHGDEGEKHFVDQYREKLIQNITMVHPVLDHLQQRDLLTPEHCSNVKAENTTQNQMRKLLKYSRGWRHNDKDILCMALREHNPGVLENLEGRNEDRRLPDKVKKSNVNHVGDCRMKYMESAKQKYQLIQEHNSLPGENVDLEDRYTNLLMIRNTRKIEEREHEITALGIKHLQIMDERSSPEYSPTTLEALFDPNPKGIIPTAVVLQGPSGIGKTMTSQKIMLDWASGNLYQDKFNFAFHLNCRELNTITDKVSLARLLSTACGLICPEDMMKSVLSNSEKLLLIVDGFDELKWSLENVKENCDDPFQENSIEVLLKSLLNKQCLPEVSLIITTRPMAIQKLHQLIKKFRSRFVDILGFTGEDHNKYVRNFFENPEDAAKALSIIKDNDYLYTLCAVPIMSWIVCTLIKPEIKKELDLIPYQTITSLYLSYLKGLIMYHGREDDGREQSVHASLKKLCALANKGILNHQILFAEEDLEELHLSKFKSVFVNEDIFHHGIGTRTCYSFTHLSVQEFLAALYYVMDDGSEKNTSLPEICKGNSCSELCKDHPHLALVVRFLFGFLNEKVVTEFSKSTGINISLQKKSAMIKWIVKHEKSIISIESICCLNETQDEDFIRRVMSRSCLIIGAMHYKYLRMKNSSKELCYCLKICKSFKNISFQHLTMDAEDQIMLSPFIHGCQQLSLTDCDLTPSCCDNLRSVLIANRSVTKLYLSRNPLKDSGVRLLCEGLRYPGCTLQELRLNDCNLTSMCCDDLCSVLITNRSLIKLDLSNNRLQDSGAKCLCKALINPCCTLQELSLNNCWLTPLCCDDLLSVLITNQFLVKLDLSKNPLQDEKKLFKGLRDPSCRLQELRLRYCYLTSLCCDDLCSVLITNQSLRKLDLSRNDLEDSGIKLLCEGLRDPNCTLQELSLQDCFVLSPCCDEVRSALITNQSLIKLDLSKNSLWDSGMKLLCEGLRHPGCTLQELSLQKCRLTSLCCEDLHSVLITNRSLRKLDLSENPLQDSGIKRLCEGLQDPGCTLQDLRIIHCSGTLLCCQSLYLVVSTNRTLTRLETRLCATLPDFKVDLCVEHLRRLGCIVEQILDDFPGRGYITFTDIVYTRQSSVDQ